MVLPVRQYNDLNLSFVRNPVTNDVAGLTGADAVRRAIRNLVLTNFYELWFKPSKGSGVQAHLFENITSITQQRLETAIKDVIANFEPRANTVTMNIVPDYSENGYAITVSFEVLNELEPVSITVFLTRA